MTEEINKELYLDFLKDPKKIQKLNEANNLLNIN